MKALFAIVFLMLVVLFAQAQKRDSMAIVMAVESLRKAMINADSTVLNTLTYDDLSYGHSGGKVEGKTSFIFNILSRNSNFVSIDLTDQSILVKGKTAIVRHLLTATTNDNGKPGNVKLMVLLVWSKEGREWKLIARQAVKAS